MLPASYHVPAGLVLLVSGLLACFAGYRLFRVVLALFGFILGALFASSLVAPSNETGMIVAAIVGGVVGAAIMFAAYFVGVVLVGAGVGALVVYLIWAPTGGDPHPLIVILFAVLGGMAGWIFQRYVIILGTAFGGAWTTLAGAAALVGDRLARRVPPSDQVWLEYPTNPAPGQRWLIVAWFVLGVIGTAVQLRATRGGKKRR